MSKSTYLQHLFRLFTKQVRFRFFVSFAVLALFLALTFHVGVRASSDPVDSVDHTVDENQSMIVPIGPIFAPDTSDEYAEKMINTLRRSNSRFNLSSHWNPAYTASGGGGASQGDALTLTWSIIPDGTVMPGYAGEASCRSHLIESFNSVYGDGQWQNEIANVFADWSATTGNKYVQETADDGASWPSSRGQKGVRGDIRIGGCKIDGNSGILAYNFYPSTGDMKIDAVDSFYRASNLRTTFHNVISHEHGHGAGVAHVCPVNQTKLMEPYVTSAFTGLQHDDIRAIQRHYGDVNELIGNPNDSANAATSFGAVSDGVEIQREQLSIDDNSDEDWFSFDVGSNRQISFMLTPVGLTYDDDPQISGSCPSPVQNSTNSLAIHNLGFEIYDSDQTSKLATVNANAAGASESINAALGSAGTKYIRVFGDSTNDIQLYNLDFTVSASVANGVEVSPDATQSGIANTTVVHTLYVTNTGNLSDNFTLAATSNRWSTTLDTNSLSAINGGASASTTISVTIPLTASTGMNDQVTVTATSSNDPSLKASATLTTIAIGALISPSLSSRSGDSLNGVASKTVTYTIEVQNNGNLSDTFGLQATGSTWITTLSSNSSGALQAGEKSTLQAVVEIPAGTANGVTDSATITATSTLSPSISSTLLLTTSAAAESYGVVLSPSMSKSAMVSTTVAYTLEVTNTGNLADQFTMTLGNNQWPTTLSTARTSTLNPLDKTSVMLSVTIPLTATGGSTDTVMITATSKLSPTVSHYTTLTTTAIARSYGIDLASDSEKSGVASNLVTYTLQVSNTGNISDIFTMTVENGNTWTTTVSPVTVTLGISETTEVQAVVKIPVTATTGLKDTSIIYATSSLSPSISSHVSLTTTATARSLGVDLPATLTGSGVGSTTVTHTLHISNTGNTADTFTITVGTGYNWTTTLSSKQVTLAVSETQAIQVGVAIPFTATTGMSDSTVITATSVISPSIQDSTQMTTTAITANVGVNLLSDQSNSGMADSTLNYTLKISNTGNVPDTFDLTVGGNSWSTSLSTNSTDELNGGESSNVVASVSIPSSASENDQDTVTITATSRLSPTIYATAQLTTTAVPLSYGVDLSPNEHLSGTTGSTINYTLRITNTGNTADTFTLAVLSGGTWTTTLASASTGSLNRDQTTTIAASVQIPSTALAGASDTVTIRATSQGSGAISDTTTLTTSSIMRILSPLESNPANAGPNTAPKKITVEVSKPAFELSKSDFTVTVGASNATIVTLSELNDRYQLEILPPTQGANGLYDLKVQYQAISATETKAVRHASDKNVDISVILDRSGSMGGQPIVDARNASKMFVDFMRSGDYVGVGSFSNNTRIDFVLSEVAGDVKTNAKGAIDSISASGATSIGGGLQIGQNELTSRGQAEHPWALVLLSDGQENSAPYTDDVLAGIAESKTAVHTIGLGSGTDEALMLKIAQQTGGTYNYAPSSDQLASVYHTIAGTVSNQQMLRALSGSVAVGASEQLSVTVDSTVSEATFSVAWSGNGTIELDLIKPDNTVITSADASGNADIEYVSGSNYKYYRVSGSTLVQGLWYMRLTGGNTTLRVPVSNITYQTSVSADSNLTMDISLDKQSYLQTEPIKIVASLADNQPISGATINLVVTLPSQATSSVILYDDGQHDDGAANDGVYANIFSGTTEKGSYQFSATATGTSTNNESFTREAELTTYVDTNPTPNAIADLSITNTDNADPITAGNNVTYQLQVTNNGSDDATNVIVTNNLPTELSYQSANSSGSCTHSSGTVICKLSSLANGASTTISIVAKSSQSGNFTNEASVTSSDVADSNSNNNSASQSTTVNAAPAPTASPTTAPANPTATPTASSTTTPTTTPTATATPTSVPNADLSVSITGSSDALMIGQNATYQLAVANAGPLEAQNVVLVDQFDHTNMTFVSASPSVGTCTHTNGTVTCSLGSLSSGGQATVNLVVTANQSGMSHHTASVSSDVADNNASNNSAKINTGIQAEKQIEAAVGGTFNWNNSEGGHVTINIPPNALTADMVMCLTPSTPSTAPPNFSYAGQGFILAANTSCPTSNRAPMPAEAEEFTFNAPITVTMSYSDSQVANLNENALLLNYWDTSRQQWVNAATSCQPTSTYQRQPYKNKITVEICHLTEFGLFAPAENHIPTAVTLNGIQLDMMQTPWVLLIGLLVTSLSLLAWRRQKQAQQIRD